MLPLINTILESIRLLVSVTFDIKILRQLFSLTLALLDFARGEWKNAILSFLGVFSRDWLLIGVVGKTGRWVYNFISPDIQENLEEDIFKSGKSMFIGVWLWLASILSPSFIRKRINSLIENINIKAKKINEEIESIEKRAQAGVIPTGYVLDIPTIDMDRIPSFADIQNFQMILRQPLILCNISIKEILKKSYDISVFKIFLEFLNIPTDKRLDDYCEKTFGSTDTPTHTDPVLVAASQLKNSLDESSEPSPPPQAPPASPPAPPPPPALASPQAPPASPQAPPASPQAPPVLASPAPSPAPSPALPAQAPPPAPSPGFFGSRMFGQQRPFSPPKAFQDFAGHFKKRGTHNSLMGGSRKKRQTKNRKTRKSTSLPQQ